MDFRPFNFGAALGRLPPPDVIVLQESWPRPAWRSRCKPFGERRPRSCRRWKLASAQSVDDFSCPELTRDQHFGELLRHELNNPLTGILGNAELLFAETRRQNPPQLSEPGVKRLETIAALAVRMRETVPHLSQASESRG